MDEIFNWIRQEYELVTVFLHSIFGAIHRSIHRIIWSWSFAWIRPGYELVTVRLSWNVQVPFLQTKDGKGQRLDSPLFSPHETPNSKWTLGVLDIGMEIKIFVMHLNSAGKTEHFVEPALVEISILNKHSILTSDPMTYCVTFYLSKEDIIKWKCQQPDGSLTFSCKIFTHVVESESISSSADLVFAVDCTGGLSSHLEELFNDMSLSDVSFNIGGREFPAHKNILSARSQYFAAMFKHPMKEQSTNKIKMEDIEPDVFQELLHFIYTGRVSKATMELMAAGLFIAADKYLLGELKKKCENYLIHHMSPNNCVVLLLHDDDLFNTAEPLKEAAKFLRRFPNEVMATDEWKKMKQENPVLLCDIQQSVFCLK
jgi:speckle-type POZ protein